MKMVIGPNTPNRYEEIIENSLKVNKICGLDKTIDYQVYLFNCNVNEIGLIMGTEILLDELFITFKVKEVYLYNVCGNVENYCLYYGVPFYIL